MFLQIQELETENSELKKQLQALEEQLMISHVPPVRTRSPDTDLQFRDFSVQLIRDSSSQYVAKND